MHPHIRILGAALLWLGLAAPLRAEDDLAAEPTRHQLAVKGGFQSLFSAKEIGPTDLEPDDFSGLALNLAYQYGVASNAAFMVDYLAMRQDEEYGLGDGRGEMSLSVNALLFTTAWRTGPPDRPSFYLGPGIGLYSGEIRYKSPSEQVEGALVNVRERALSFGAHLTGGFFLPLVPSFGIGVENRLGWTEFDMDRAGQFNLAHNLTSLVAAWNF